MWSPSATAFFRSAVRVFWYPATAASSSRRREFRRSITPRQEHTPCPSRSRRSGGAPRWFLDLARGRPARVAAPPARLANLSRPEPHDHAVEGPVVDQGNGVGGHGRPVERGARDAPAGALRILDDDRVARPPEPPLERARGPGGRDAGVDREDRSAP